MKKFNFFCLFFLFIKIGFSHHPIEATPLKTSQIYCIAESNRILFNWTDVPTATEYIVFVNGDSTTTISESEFLVENLQQDEMVEFGIQPIGLPCGYTFSSLTYQATKQTACLPTANGQPAGDEPPGCFLCGPIYQGSTAGFTADSLGFDFPCGNIENNQWISFIADSSGSVSMAAIASNCSLQKGIEIALYDTNLNLISDCFTSSGTNVPALINTSIFSPGEIHFAMIDGLDEDECDFLITMSDGICVKPPPAPKFFQVAPDYKVICPGTEICYTVSPTIGATEYNWIIPPNGTVTSGGQIHERSVCVLYNSPGSDTIQVTPSNSCFQGIPSKLGIRVSDTIPAPKIDCEPDVRKVLFTWEEVSGADQYIVFVNGDSLSTTVERMFLVENLNFGEAINFTVQPVSTSCFYEMGEIECYSNYPPSCLPINNGIPAGNEPPGCYLCGPIYQGSTAGYTAENTDIDFPCGTIENNQWIAVQADSSTQFSATILSSNCQNNQGVEMAIYDSNLNLVSDCFSSQGVLDTGFVQTNQTITPGAIYFIMVDGYEGDECDILLTTSIFNPGEPSDPPGPITVTPNTTRFCPGAEATYSIDPVAGATNYEWKIPGNAIVIEGGGRRDTYISIEFIGPGGGVVSVTPSNPCFPGIPSILPVIVLPIIPNLGEYLTVCPDEFPIWVGPYQIDSAGSYTFVFTNALGCDSTVLYTVTESPIIPEIIDTIICAGTCVELGDSCYFESTSELIDLFCREITELNIVTIDSFPAPFIECQMNTSNIFFTWEEVVGAEEYLVTINGDSSILRGLTNIVFFDIPVDSSIMIEVQPMSSSACIFKSATLTCPEPSGLFSVKKEGFNFNIFPNPSSGFMEISSDFKLEKIEIFDPSGEIVKTESPNSFLFEMTLDSELAGLFFVKAYSARGISVRRVLVL